MSLYSLAKKFENKYFRKTALNAEDVKDGIVKHIQQMIANASTVSESSGIMPFVASLAQDNATLSFMVVKNSKDISISNLSVSPPELTGKYQALPAQVTKYLEKNWELFPSAHNGSSISYNNFAFTLHYGAANDIAIKPE